ncbi:hypothetical protein [Candidatus Arthromitus sp. SFB-rat-Yit]|uniref:hypothetical protein n=1 Tax=Candidatus Arthromitus sp. SFB-rat-Yit TaxID=1041504 RepID=UPI000227A3DA|nr:hypothetical protein [Candidatus Arthromitus sp. SFB-rat-Yit]BAK80891.1 rod shape-determining protein MreD [Candidatus Arthromitus sp. SFB-rat-Yit]
MRFVVLFVLSVFFFILDISLIPIIATNGVYTSLANIYFLMCCMNIEKHEVVYFSLIIGFFQDIFFTNGFGFNIFLNISLGILFYYVAMKCNKNKYFLSVSIISIFSALRSLITSIFLSIFLGIGINWLYLIYELIHIFIFSAFIYLLLNKMFKGKLFRKSLEF